MPGGLGVDLAAITSIIALNQATAVLGPVGASFADRYGNRRIILVSLVMLWLSDAWAAGLIPMYAALVMALFLAGLAKSIFDPSFQAFLGTHVPFEQRGKFIGYHRAGLGRGHPGGNSSGRHDYPDIFIPDTVSGLSLSWQPPVLVLISRLMPRDCPSGDGHHSRKTGLFTGQLETDHEKPPGPGQC